MSESQLEFCNQIPLKTSQQTQPIVENYVSDIKIKQTFKKDKTSCKYVNIEHLWNDSQFCLYRTKKITVSMKTKEPGVYFLSLVRVEKNSTQFQPSKNVPMIVRGFDRKKITSTVAIIRNSHGKGEKIQFDFYLRKVHKNFSELSSFPMESYRYDGINYDYFLKLIYTKHFSNESKVISVSGRFNLKFKPSKDSLSEKLEIHKEEEIDEKRKFIEDVKKDAQLLLK